jgi:hypothetical protein
MVCVIMDSADTLHALKALGLAPGATPLSGADLLLRLLPRDEGLQAKDIPVEALQAKITAARDKVRVLEQRINAATLPAAERQRLHQHITSLYVALNALATFPTEEAFPALPTEPSS